MTAKENSLIKHFMALRINTLFNIRYIPRDASHINAPFYEFSVETMRQCYHLKGFPNVNSKSIYKMLLPITKPEAENMYPNFNWNNIWNNLCFKFINVYNRQIMFKFPHEILPNRKKLSQ